MHIGRSGRNDPVKRVGLVGDDDPHRSESQTLQGVTLAIKIFQRVLVIYMVGLEEAIQFVSGFKAQHAAELGLGDMPGLEFFQREPFERPARKVGAAFGGQTAGKLIGNLDRQVHALTVPRRDAGGQRRSPAGWWSLWDNASTLWEIILPFAITLSRMRWADCQSAAGCHPAPQTPYH